MKLKKNTYETYYFVTRGYFVRNADYTGECCHNSKYLLKTQYAYSRQRKLVKFKSGDIINGINKI